MIVSRFAPAPTGFLHLGHVVNAVYVWGVARSLGGRVLLRIEDHDRQRCRVEFERAMLDDLSWLGFEADAPLTRQSERGAIYETALATLRAQGLVYHCECSRSAIAASAGPPDAELRYPGTCARKGLSDGPGRGTRVRMERSVIDFDDLRHGAQQQCPADQCGDVLLRDRDGNWTYQFAVVADDLDQGVTLVARGDDLLPSTGRQIQLARLLGRARPPEFLHHLLVMKSTTQKLSKSDRDTGIQELRANGWRPAQVIGHAAHLAGLLPDSATIDASEVARCFSGDPFGLRRARQRL